jgi:hypothetical protein
MTTCGKRPKEEGVSAIGADCGWELMGRSANTDAVDEALARQSENVKYGSRYFAFTKVCAACGDILLVLAERGCVSDGQAQPTLVEPMANGFRVEQRVSAVSRDLDAPTRARVEARVPCAVGRSFFIKAAQMLDAEGV